MTAALSPETTVTRHPATVRWPLANVLPPMGALPTAPADLRQHASTMLAVWELRHFGTLDADTRTVVSELVANAVRTETAPDGTPVLGRDGRPRPLYVDGQLPEIRFGIFSDRAVVQVEIRDTLPGLPELQPRGAFGEHGHGLVLVDALSEQWGTRPDGGGKVVWARLRVSHGRR